MMDSNRVGLSSRGQSKRGTIIINSDLSAHMWPQSPRNVKSPMAQSPRRTVKFGGEIDINDMTRPLQFGSSMLKLPKTAGSYNPRVHSYGAVSGSLITSPTNANTNLHVSSRLSSNRIQITQGFSQSSSRLMTARSGLADVPPPPSQLTFSQENLRLFTRLKYIQQQTANMSQSSYLDMQQRGKIAKLQKQADSFKNEAKNKREMLSRLKFELEQLMLKKGETGDLPQQNPEKIEEGKHQEQKSRLSLSMASLRPSMSNLGTNLATLSNSISINNHLTHLGSPITSKVAVSPNKLDPSWPKPVPEITQAPQLSVSLYQPYYPMLQDDDLITANLEKMRDDLSAQLKQVTFKMKSEFFTRERLTHQQTKERDLITYLKLKQRELQPDKSKYEKAIVAIPRVQMLGATSREIQKNLVSERRAQLEKRKDFYHNILQQRVKALKTQSRELDDLKAAIAKRERRVEEVKDYINELRESNADEEDKRQACIRQLVNRNMEFKVFAGLEVIIKLEEALKSLDTKEEPDYQNPENGADAIARVRNGALRVADMSYEDFRIPNKKKIKILQSYEAHFSQFFTDIQKVKINDTYLNTKYNELCFKISSKTHKFQELVQKCHLQKKMIKQYEKFKATVTKDLEYLRQFEAHSEKILHKKETSTSVVEDKVMQNFTKKRSSLTQMDTFKNNQIIAKCLSLMLNSLQRQEKLNFYQWYLGCHLL